MKEQTTSRLEERWNTLTHGFGVVLGLIFAPMLVYTAASTGHTAYLWAVSIFSASLLVMYAFSTWYHHARDPRLKDLLRILDHISIYYLIAGTYTPFIVFFVSGTQQVVLLGIMWGIALLGTVFKLFFTGRFEWFSTALYLLMGWMVIFIGQPIISGLSEAGLTWLIIGGGGYSAGVVFYLWERLKFNHVIWHLFVLLGSVSHFVAIWISLQPV